MSISVSPFWTSKYSGLGITTFPRKQDTQDHLNEIHGMSVLLAFWPTMNMLCKRNEPQPEIRMPIFSALLHYSKNPDSIVLTLIWEPNEWLKPPSAKNLSNVADSNFLLNFIPDRFSPNLAIHMLGKWYIVRETYENWLASWIPSNTRHFWTAVWNP